MALRAHGHREHAAAGAVIGAAQGWFVAFRKIPSFIVTLAGMLVFKGLTLALLEGQSVGPFPEEFQRLSSGFIPDPLGGDALRTTSLVVGALAAARWCSSSCAGAPSWRRTAWSRSPMPSSS
jgi:ABC-type xylose transport system permease subunit